jgi:hypothetical protein
MARNIATTKLVNSVAGLKELQDNIGKMIDRFDGQELQSDMAALAMKGAQMLEDEAAAKGWPKRAIESIFVYGKLDPKERRRKGPSALFGFRKRGRSEPYAPGYVEWNPGRSRSMRAKSLVLPGLKTATGALQKIGMSLATMFEFGTAKMKARPALRPTIFRLKARYPAELAAILHNILAKHSLKR